MVESWQASGSAEKHLLPPLEAIPLWSPIVRIPSGAPVKHGCWVGTGWREIRHLLSGWGTKGWEQLHWRI